MRLIHWRTAFVFTLPYCRACYVAGERGEIGRIGLAAYHATGEQASPKFWSKVRSLGNAHYAAAHPELAGRFSWWASFNGAVRREWTRPLPEYRLAADGYALAKDAEGRAGAQEQAEGAYRGEA